MTADDLDPIKQHLRERQDRPAPGPMKWRRIRDDVYVNDRGVRIQRLDPPNNSHISLWVVVGMKGHFPTFGDAKRWVSSQSATPGTGIPATPPRETKPTKRSGRSKRKGKNG